MVKKKSAKVIYNGFFEQFKKKSGYIGSILKNKSGNSVFEFEFKLGKDIEEAKSYLSTMPVKTKKDSVNPKKFLVILD